MNKDIEDKNEKQISIPQDKIIEFKNKIFNAYQDLQELIPLFEKKQNTDKRSGQIVIDTFNQDMNNLKEIVDYIKENYKV